MQGEPEAAGFARARAIREKATELGALLGIPDGTPWTVELVYGPIGYLRLHRHQGPLKTDDDLMAIARSVGVYRD